MHRLRCFSGLGRCEWTRAWLAPLIQQKALSVRQSRHYLKRLFGRVLADDFSGIVVLHAHDQLPRSFVNGKPHRGRSSLYRLDRPFNRLHQLNVAYGKRSALFGHGLQLPKRYWFLLPWRLNGGRLLLNCRRPGTGAVPHPSVRYNIHDNHRLYIRYENPRSRFRLGCLKYGCQRMDRPTLSYSTKLNNF